MTLCAHCQDPINPDHLTDPDSTGDYCAECDSLPRCDFCGDLFATAPVYVYRCPRTPAELQDHQSSIIITCSLLCARIVRDTQPHEPWRQADLDAVEQQRNTRRMARQRAAAERDHQRALERWPAPTWSDDTECQI